MATRYPSNRDFEPQPGIRREQPRSARPGNSASARSRSAAPRSGGYAPRDDYRASAGRRPSGQRAPQGQRPRQGRPPQGRPQPGRRPPQRRRRNSGNRFYGLLAALAGILVVAVLVILLVKPFGRKPAPVATNVADSAPVQSANAGAADTNAGAAGASAFEGVEDLEETRTLDSYSSLNAALGDADADVGSLSAEDMAQVSDLSINTNLPSEWLNVLLLGTDERYLNDSARTDSMMICSINRNTGEVKLASIQRDLAIDFTGLVKKYPGTYRINAANYFGGPKLAMKVVNEKFGMNIQYYVVVNFFGFQRIAQQLGGIDIDITEDEMRLINQYAKHAWKVGKRAGIDISDLEYEVLTTYGQDTHLNGTQTLAYARIRKLDGGDYMRSERQRAVLGKLMEKVKTKNALEIATMATSMLDQVKTNLELNDIINTAMLVAGNGISGMKSMRLPVTGTYSEERRNDDAMLWDCDFATNAVQLYNFIYES